MLFHRYSPVEFFQPVPSTIKRAIIQFEQAPIVLYNHHKYQNLYQPKANDQLD